MGTHLLVNLYGCPKKTLQDADCVLRLLNEIVEESKLNKVGEIAHQFKPGGATVIILLAESHLSIHTWPEMQSAAADIFCCNSEDNAEKAFEIMKKKFRPKKVEKRVVKR